MIVDPKVAKSIPNSDKWKKYLIDFDTGTEIIRVGPGSRLKWLASGIESQSFSITELGYFKHEESGNYFSAPSGMIQHTYQTVNPSASKARMFNGWDYLFLVHGDKLIKINGQMRIFKKQSSSTSNAIATSVPETDASAVATNVSETDASAVVTNSLATNTIATNTIATNVPAATDTIATNVPAVTIATNAFANPIENELLTAVATQTKRKISLSTEKLPFHSPKRRKISNKALKKGKKYLQANSIPELDEVCIDEEDDNLPAPVVGHDRARTIRLSITELKSLKAIVKSKNRASKKHCPSCGGPWSISSQKHVAHIVTRCQGGNDTIENLTIVCSGCNTTGKKTTNQLDRIYVGEVLKKSAGDGSKKTAVDGSKRYQWIYDIVSDSKRNYIESLREQRLYSEADEISHWLLGDCARYLFGTFRYNSKEPLPDGIQNEYMYTVLNKMSADYLRINENNVAISNHERELLFLRKKVRDLEVAVVARMSETKKLQESLEKISDTVFSPLRGK